MKKPLSFLLAIAFVFSCFSVNVFASVRVASAFDYGDVNGDRYINAKDALLVLQGAVGKIQLADQQHTAADVTQDGQPDGKDALEILKKAVGKPADFPGYVIPSVSEAVKDTVHVASLWASDYADNTQIGKVWQTAFDDLVKRKGIATGVQPLRDENLVERLVANSRAGVNDVDVYEVSPAVALGVARKGLAADLNTSKTLQLERFHENATAHMTFGNSLYGVGITANITQPTVVFYNKNYIEQYAPDTNIPALVKNKQWTFEAFTALAKACQIDTDGNGKLDIYGFTANHQRIDALVAANKGGLATMEQGRVVTSVELEKSKNDINWLRSWVINDRVWKLTGRNLDEQTVFAQGEAAMLVSPLNNHKAITQKAPFPVGIAPMPMGPDATHYNTGHLDARVYMVLQSNAGRLDPIGTWLSGVSSVSGKLRNLEIKELLLNEFDNDTVEWYKSLMENARWDYAIGVHSNTITEQIRSLVTSRPKTPWHNFIGPISWAAQVELDEFYDPLYE